MFGTVLPSQMMVPSDKSSRSITSGGAGGGGGLADGLGMSSFTAWFMMGSVRISMMSSTSITSINGVVLISHIASPSLLSPTDIDMVGGLLRRYCTRAALAMLSA